MNIQAIPHDLSPHVPTVPTHSEEVVTNGIEARSVFVKEEPVDVSYQLETTIVLEIQTYLQLVFWLLQLEITLWLKKAKEL